MRLFPRLERDAREVGAACARLMPPTRIIRSFGCRNCMYICKGCGEALTEAIESGECRERLAA
jgi:hypothetical protein